MTQIDAQVVFQGGSQLPEDVFVNTFKFVTPTADSAADQALVAAALVSFYEVSGGAATPVGAFLSEYIDRSYEVKTYDRIDASPRQPTITTSTLPAHATSDFIPEEVCACLTFRGDAPFTARRRGRIYVGPLNSTAVTNGGQANPSRVSIALRSSLTQAAAALAANTDVGWSVWSPTAGLYTPITNGWVDNAFDTQHRRGVDPTDRLLWNI